MRLAPLFFLAIIALAPVGCGRDEENQAFSFHKASVTQTQLLDDEEKVRKLPGVIRVIPIHHQDGSATLSVEVDDAHHIDIQRKMSAMGYTKGMH
jgi:hypothetical protein